MKYDVVVHLPSMMTSEIVMAQKSGTTLTQLLLALALCAQFFSIGTHSTIKVNKAHFGRHKTKQETLQKLAKKKAIVQIVLIAIKTQLEIWKAFPWKSLLYKKSTLSRVSPGPSAASHCRTQIVCQIKQHEQCLDLRSQVAYVFEYL